MLTVPPRAKGLGSNYNYYLSNPGTDNKGAPVTDLSVTIVVTQDIVADIGCGFQLQGYSAPNSATTWQQYCWGFDPAGATPYIECSVEYFPNSANSNNNLPGNFNTSQLPSPQTIPAGYVFTVKLSNDSSGNVTQAAYKVTANDGTSKSWQTDIPWPGVPQVAPAPMYSFQLNFVGRNGGVCTFLESGAGVITYEASCPLTVSNRQTTQAENPTEFTVEEANSSYSQLQAGPFDPHTPIVQTFWANTKTMIYRPGGYFAVSQQFGVNHRTNLYAVSQTGQLVVFSVDGRGRWRSSPGLGPVCMSRPGTGVASSRQFGANNQTNVFVVDRHGQLNTFWAESDGPWRGPIPIGPANHCSSGGFLAASQQFGVPNQTDVFLVDKDGTLNMFWGQSAASWNAEQVAIGPQGNFPSGAPLAVSQQFGAPDQTDVFLIDNSGALTAFSVRSTGSWGNPVHIGDKFPKGAFVAASQRFGVPNQTDVYAVDQRGTLNVFSVQGTGIWTEAVPIGPSGLAVPGAPVAVSRRFGVHDRTDVFVVDTNGQINVFSVRGAGNWSEAAQIGAPGIAPDSSQASNGALILASLQFGVTDRTNLFLINQNGTNGPGWPSVYWADGDGEWNGPSALVTEA